MAEAVPLERRPSSPVYKEDDPRYAYAMEVYAFLGEALRAHKESRSDGQKRCGRSCSPSWFIAGSAIAVLASAVGLLSYLYFVHPTLTGGATIKTALVNQVEAIPSDNSALVDQVTALATSNAALVNKVTALENQVAALTTINAALAVVKSNPVSMGLTVFSILFCCLINR